MSTVNLAATLAGILELIMKEAPILMRAANDIVEQYKQEGDPTQEQTDASVASLDAAHDRFKQALADREAARRE